MFFRNTRWFLGIAVGGALSLAANSASAQITPDTTLPNNSTVTINGNTFNIDGGTQAGRNLFHSFQQFSVPTNGTASFNNAVNIQNIFSRVTGTSVSNIDGIIKASGTANLFLINPNGIIFGPNASLNVGGSFVGTTANAIQFGDRGFFSATNPNNPALLTVNPSALFFNQIAAAARIENNSVAAVRDPAGFNTFGLRVPDGKSLLLVGGNVNMDGGWLNAYGGRVELGGLISPGNVGLNVDGDKLSLDFTASSTRADISLTNGASVNVSAGGGGGNIVVNARNLDITGRSSLIGGIEQGLGSVGTQAGDITLNATGEIKVVDSSVYNDVGNSVALFAIDNSGNLVVYSAVGNGGNINISSGSFSLLSNAYLSASTYGQGNAGSVKIDVSGPVSVDNSSVRSLVSSNYISGTGNSGGISINSGSLTVANSAELNTGTTFGGIGRAGDITIKARDQVLFNGGFARSRLEKGGRGRAGDISITTDGSVKVTGIRSDVADARIGQLVSATFGEGDAGNITISAGKDVEFNGRGSDIYTLEGTDGGMGNAGNIKIDSRSLSVLNGARLIASTENQRNAGNINITARDTIKVDGTSNGTPSQVATTVRDYNSQGYGGQINLNTKELSITNGAQLIFSTNNQDASDININASDRISFDGTGSGLFSSVNSGGRGRGASVNLTTGSLHVTNGAQVNSSTSGRGNAGSLNVNASDSVVLRGTSPDGFSSGLSTSSASSATGSAGSLTIKTPTLQVRNGAGVSTSTLGEGSTGDITIDATNTTSLDGAKSAVSNTSGTSLAPVVSIRNEGGRLIVNLETLQRPIANAKGNSGNINITTGSLTVRNGARLDTSTSAQGNAGNISVDTRNAIFSGTDTNGTSSGAFSTVQKGASGNGGVININTADKLTVDNGAQLVTSTSGNGNAGEVRIVGKEVLFNGVSGSNPSGAFSAVASSGVGKGGNVNVRTTGSLSVTNGAQLSATTDTGGQGNAGSINITTKRLNIVNGAEGTVSNLGSGNAGKLEVKADFIDLNNQGKLRATSVTGFGGNTELNVKDILLMRGGSLISNLSGTPQVGGNEGNFKLNTKFLVAPSNDNNDIITNAFSGSGGNINIFATGEIYGFVVRKGQRNPDQLRTNDIIAISQTRPIIVTGDLDPSNGFVSLPADVFDPSKQITQGCAAFDQANASDFQVTGRGGLPPSPDEPLSSDAVWEDTRLGATTAQRLDSKTTATKPKSESDTVEIIPATGWVFNGKGEVTLVSHTPNATVENLAGSSQSCRVR